MSNNLPWNKMIEFCFTTTNIILLGTLLLSLIDGILVHIHKRRMELHIKRRMQEEEIQRSEDAMYTAEDIAAWLIRYSFFDAYEKWNEWSKENEND